MSQEQLKSFLAKAKDDESIQEKLKTAKSAEDVIGIAKEYGHEFTSDKISQLSEDDLQEVSGGITADEILKKLEEIGSHMHFTG